MNGDADLTKRNQYRQPAAATYPNTVTRKNIVLCWQKSFRNKGNVKARVASVILIL